MDSTFRIGWSYFKPKSKSGEEARKKKIAF